MIDASGAGALGFTNTGILSPDLAGQTITTTSGSAFVTVTSTAGLAEGMIVRWNNGTSATYTIGSIDSATKFELSSNVAAGDAGTFTDATFGCNTARTITLTGTNTDANTIAGVLQNSSASGTGTLSVTKTGAGTWLLTGANTYTGTTTVNAGQQYNNGNQSSATGAVSVAANATLGGTGSLGGAATFSTGAKAVFTVTRDAITGANTTPLTIAGVMTFNSTVVHLNLPANLPSGTYTLATSSATPTGTVTAAPVVDSGTFAAGFISAVVSLDTTNQKLLLTVNGTPTIITSGTLVAVDTTYGTASTSPTSFTISGGDLDGAPGNLTVTPPSGYEVSLSSGSGYSTSLSVPYSGPTLDSATVYVRLAASTASGTYAGNITVSGGGAASPATCATVSSAVSPAPLTITAKADSKTYGQTKTYGSGLTAITSVTVSGLQNSDAVDTVTIMDSNNGGPASAAVGGTYLLTPSAAHFNSGSPGNYTISYHTAQLTVNPATLTVTATGPSKSYGTALTVGTSSLNFSHTGEVNGESVTSVTLTPDAAGLSTTTAAGSGYIVTPSAPTGSGGFLAANYIIIPVVYNGTVAKAALTITANTQSKTYGSTQASPVTGSTAFTPTGLQNGETVGTVTLTYGSGGLSATDAAGATSTITPSAASGGTFTAANYAITYAPGVLTVNPAALTVTANADSKTYGRIKTYGSGSNAYTITAGTLQNNDAASTVTISDTDGGGLATATAGGIYHLTPSALVFTTGSAANYAITYATGLLSVNQSALTVTANPDTKTYGSMKTYANGSSAYSITAGTLQNSDAVSTVTITDTDGGGLATAAAGGIYHLTPSALVFTTGSAANYAITYATGLLSVNQAALTITANADSKTYGSVKTYGSGSNAYTITAGTLQNSDAVSTVTITDTDGGGLATAAAGATYHLTPSALVFTTGTAANYAITYATGLLSVNPAALTVSANADSKRYGQTKTYGSGSSAYTITAGTLQNSDAVSTVTITDTDGGGLATAAAGGIYHLTPSALVFTTGSAANYAITYAPGLLSVSAYILAVADAGQTVELGAFHVGTPKTSALTLTNTAPPGAFTETLQTNGFSGTSANFTASGSASGIAGGASASGSLMVGVGAGLGGGAQSGTTILALQSDEVPGSGLGTTPLPSQTVTIHASGYNLAGTTFNMTAVSLPTIHVGGSFGFQNLSVDNTLGAGAFNETLGAQLANATGVTTSGSPLTVVAGAAANTGMGLSLTATTAGLKSGTVDVQFNSQAVNGSGLGTTPLAASNKTITVTGGVFNGVGVWTQTTGSSGSWASAASWMDANGVAAAPGTFAGYANVDTATISDTGTTATVNLDGTSPSIKILNLSASSPRTIAQGSGNATLIMRGSTSGASITASSTGHVISAPVTLTGNFTVTVTNSSDTLTISGAIGGSGGSGSLTKSGTGTLVLSGVNTYSGSTAVTNGTLVITNPSLANSSTLSIGSVSVNTAVLNLPNAGTDLVGSLVINGVTKAPGLYDSTNSSGAITGIGKILVDPYATFVSVIANPAYRNPGDDPDGDGIPNAIEFVIGGSPASVNDQSLLPTAELVSTNFGNGFADYLIFTYRRTFRSAYLTPAVEYATDLTGPWFPASNGVSGLVVVTTTNGYAAGVDKVETYIPKSLAVSGRLFARLKVAVPP